MNRKFGFIISFLIIGFLLFPLSTGAEEKKAQPSKEFGDFGWISRGQKYGYWWILNSRWYDPPPDPILYHLETSFSYSDTTGNVDGEYWDVRTNLTLRKKFVNSDTSYTFKRSDTKTTFGNTFVESENFTEMLSFDIYKWLAAEGGYIFYNDTTKFYDDSFSVFGGLGTWPLSKKNLWAKVGVYYGYGKNTYRNDSLAVFGIHMPDYDSPGIFFQEKLFWNITDKINLSQFVSYVHTFDDSEPPTIYGFKTNADDNVVQLTFNATLSFYITPIFSVFTRYELKYDDNALEGKHSIAKTLEGISNMTGLDPRRRRIAALGASAARKEGI